MLHILLRVIEARLCHRSGSAGGRVGVVSFEQRFGAALNAHVHFHCYVTDGVFAVGHDGQVHFDATGALTPEDLAGDARAGARSRVALVRPCRFALLANPTGRCRPTALLASGISASSRPYMPTPGPTVLEYSGLVASKLGFKCVLPVYFARNTGSV